MTIREDCRVDSSRFENRESRDRDAQHLPAVNVSVTVRRRRIYDVSAVGLFSPGVFLGGRRFAEGRRIPPVGSGRRDLHSDVCWTGCANFLSYMKHLRDV